MGVDYKGNNSPKPDENMITPTLINNLNCPASNNKGTSASRPCPPTELVRNGGFEESGIFETFANWEQFTANIDIQRSGIVYEGNNSAAFMSLPTDNESDKAATLRQNVTVVPGCFLDLSFADNFQQRGNSLELLQIRASVSYGTTNLINLEINYDVTVPSGQNTSVQAEKGFVFHQKVADNPVPSNVTSVTVEFSVRIRDLGLTGPGVVGPTIWLLDGVSLRAV